MDLLKRIAEAIAVSIEVGGSIIIVYGAFEALVGVIRAVSIDGLHMSGRRKKVWLGFAMWLLLGLEFELAADIVRTAISPSWNEIGQLAAIAAIRTFLNYFLEKDLEQYEPKEARAENITEAKASA